MHFDAQDALVAHLQSSPFKDDKSSSRGSRSAGLERLLPYLLSRVIFAAMSLIEELKWRGLLHDIMPGTEELMQQERVKAYVGFDPTADNLHIGNLVPIMLLVHWQRAGHTPSGFGGWPPAWWAIPAAKWQSDNSWTSTYLQHNLACQTQLEKFLDFEGDNAASCGQQLRLVQGLWVSRLHP